jgi:hypothetical protein
LDVSDTYINACLTSTPCEQGLHPVPTSAILLA